MITREFNLYLHAGHSIPLVINVNQYDHGEQWLFSLFNSDGTQYVPSSGAIVGIKSDNLGIINSGSVDSQGRVVINETQQMTAAVGKAVFELVIDDGTHGTANFVVLVEAKPGDQADLSETDISMIEQAIEAASTIKPYGSPLVASTVAGMTDHDKVYVYVGSETGYTSGNWYYWDGSAWTSGGVYNSVAVQTDTTLTLSGVAADAKKTGDEINDLKSQIDQNSGVPASVKNAIKTLLFSANYNDLDLTDEKAIIADWASAHMISISATFAQGSETIYDTDSLNYLKPFLTVTARYDDGTSGIISDYTLSGELTEGTSTITVTKDELTATFNVSVTANTLPEGYTLYDYLTANGTQYIQTNITEAQVVDWGYECKESANGTAQGNGHILSSTNVYFPFLGRGSTATDLWSVAKRYGNESATLISGTTTSYETGTPYTFKAFLDGTDYIHRLDANGEIEYTATLTKGSTGLTSSNKFALFTYGGGVTTTKYRFKGNFYYLKLTDVNGNLVHHYIPCRNANNVVGLYDVVAENFLSPTAGTFTGKAR